MTQKEKEQYQEYKLAICRNLEISQNEYDEFKKIGNRLHKLYERQCNGYHQEFMEKQDEKREEILNTKAEKLAEKLGLNIFFQTDPRGATIYLSKETMISNNYSQKGSCIY